MNDFNFRMVTAVCFVLLTCCNIQTAQTQIVKKTAAPSKQTLQISPTTQGAEADMMASMAGIACIYADWQTVSNPDSSAFMRGYNIGSILIDWRGDTTVSYALNSVGCFHNGTQHGEVRAMQQYSFCNDLYYLDSCTIYTNLEPCAMCAGMMCLEKVTRAVYAQHDPCFGGALQRLQLNSDTMHNGYPPYPRITIPVPSELPFYEQINSLYNWYCGPGTDSCAGNIVAFLATDTVKWYYQQQTNIFLNYTPVFSQNKNLYLKLLLLYSSVQPCNGSCKNVSLPVACNSEVSTNTLKTSTSKKKTISTRKKIGKDNTPPGFRR